MRKLFLIPLTLVLASCYQQERQCQNFKTGTFVFETEIDGVKKTSRFVRTDSIEIETFEGQIDTSSVRWINDCEYVLQKMNPKNRAEQKAVSMKILTTDGNTYTFEYGLVGDAKKQRGTIEKVSE
ncbi:DNA topoisomerase IV [Flavobacterium sp. JP2137]|uniref:DNA topoisomerase IV n=1 Tax=Flavobacterium sp. JP2137 TaxID=3414510 RepID=UPI003D2FE0D5